MWVFFYYCKLTASYIQERLWALCSSNYIGGKTNICSLVILVSPRNSKRWRIGGGATVFVGIGIAVYGCHDTILCSLPVNICSWWGARHCTSKSNSATDKYTVLWLLNGDSQNILKIKLITLKLLFDLWVQWSTTNSPTQIKQFSYHVKSPISKLLHKKSAAPQLINFNMKYFV